MAPSEIAFFAALFFLVGIFVAGLPVSIFLSGSATILTALALVLKKGFRSVSLVFFLLSLIAGIFYFHLYLNLRQANERIALNTEMTFQGVVRSEPQFTETTQKLVLELQSPHRGKISVITRPIPEFRYGDLFLLTGSVKKGRLGETPISFFPLTRRIGEHRGFWFKEQLLDLKGALVGQFRRFLAADSAALLAGLTLGHRSDFSEDFKAQMARSGTTHLVALSGYNIAILILAISSALGWWMGRRATFYLTTFIIFAFVLMVGAEASVVRAAIMGFLLLLAREAGRLYDFRHTVTLTAAAMVLFDPTIVHFDVGFQLSFLSLLGIVYLRPVCERAFRWDAKSAGFLNWKENFATTISAQAVVLPLLIHHFHQFSLASIASNVLILGFVPLTMFLGFLLAGFGMISSALGFMLAQPLALILGYERGVIAFFSQWDLPVVAGSGLWIFVFIYYTILVGVAAYYLKQPHAQ